MQTRLRTNIDSNLELLLLLPKCLSAAESSTLRGPVQPDRMAAR